MIVWELIPSSVGGDWIPNRYSYAVATWVDAVLGPRHLRGFNVDRRLGLGGFYREAAVTWLHQSWEPSPALFLNRPVILQPIGGYSWANAYSGSVRYLGET